MKRRRLDRFEWPELLDERYPEDLSGRIRYLTYDYGESSKTMIGSEVARPFLRGTSRIRRKGRRDDSEQDEIVLPDREGLILRMIERERAFGCERVKTKRFVYFCDCGCGGEWTSPKGIKESLKSKLDRRTIAARVVWGNTIEGHPIKRREIE